ncbi:conserved hypothetical protein [Trichinella spiralis]|uniref:hypothetical protein n=1 Tax=Trichinella spiralis TaxID=6334 RepID=UPI0001EFE265|nr:conserved hypothetical protein [Trichinella spiralis]
MLKDSKNNSSVLATKYQLVREQGDHIRTDKKEKKSWNTNKKAKHHCHQHMRKRLRIIGMRYPLRIEMFRIPKTHRQLYCICIKFQQSGYTRKVRYYTQQNKGYHKK